MQLPVSLPDWAPAWLGFALLVAGGLLLLAFLAMPFSVFGLKGRLDAVEARLDEIQREIRSLVLRLPEPAERGGRYSDEVAPDRRRWAEPPARPPIPPRPSELDRPPSPDRRVPIRTGRAAPRSEPRFDPG